MNWNEPVTLSDFLSSIGITHGGLRYMDTDTAGWMFKRDIKLSDITEVGFTRSYSYSASTDLVLRTVADVVVRTVETAYKWGLDGRTYATKMPCERRATIHATRVPSELLSQIIYVPVDTEMTPVHRSLRNWLMECFKDNGTREEAIRNYQEDGDNESVMTILRFVEENKLAEGLAPYRL